MKINLTSTDYLRIGILVLVFVVGITGSYYILKPEERLPIYNPSELDKRLVAEELRQVGINHKVLPFALQNQFGDTLTEADLEGKIYVADFFFTVCPDICKDMKISDAQEAQIRQRLLRHDFQLEGLAEDLIDHIYCYLYEHGKEDRDFTEQLEEAIKTMAPEGLESIENETFYLLNFKKMILMRMGSETKSSPSSWKIRRRTQTR